jgi:hypothetical protein
LHAAWSVMQDPVRAVRGRRACRPRRMLAWPMCTCFRGRGRDQRAKCSRRQ